MANRLKGFKQAVISEVTPLDTVRDSFTGKIHRIGGHVAVRETQSGKVHILIDGSLNAAPESLHRTGAKCWLGWMDGAGYHLPFVKPRNQPEWLD